MKINHTDIKRRMVAVIRVVEIVALMTVLAYWGLNRVFANFDAGMCGGATYSSTRSPDKMLKAYAFERDCGATTGFASWVIVKRSGEKFSPSDDLQDDEIVFSGEYQPALRWLANNQLQVSFVGKAAPRESEIWHQVLVLDQIKIVYQGFHP